MSNTNQLLNFKKNPFKVLRSSGGEGQSDIFESAFTNEACAAMTAIHLQQTSKKISADVVFLVAGPDGTRRAARQYQMSAGGNRIEGYAA